MLVITGRELALAIQTRPIDGLPDSPERIEPLLPTLPLVEKVPDRLDDQFVGVPITAASQFFVELSSQIRG